MSKPGEIQKIPEPGSTLLKSAMLEIRVRYCECDPMGVAHHGSMVPWFEMGRTELLRTSGVSYGELERAGVFLVVTKLEISYKGPVQYDDIICVQTQVESTSRVKIRHSYQVRLIQRTGVDVAALTATGRDLVVTGASTLACVGNDGRPRALPSWLCDES